jgi:hypothetical protein
VITAFSTVLPRYCSAIIFISARMKALVSGTL